MGKLTNATLASAMTTNTGKKSSACFLPFIFHWGSSNVKVTAWFWESSSSRSHRRLPLMKWFIQCFSEQNPSVQGTLSAAHPSFLHDKNIAAANLHYSDKCRNGGIRCRVSFLFSEVATAALNKASLWVLPLVLLHVHHLGDWVKLWQRMCWELGQLSCTQQNLARGRSDSIRKERQALTPVSQVHFSALAP